MNSSANFNNLKNLFNQKLGKLDAVANSLTVCEKKINELTLNEDTVSKSSLFLQSLSDTARIQVIDKISGLVTEVLQAVKDKNLTFKMELGTERGQPDLKFFVVDSLTGKEMDVLESMGGGIADLVSFALRISLLLKWQPKLERVLIVDEALKFVSVQDQELAGEFVRKLSEQLGLQIIFISHSKTLAEKAHRTFELTKENGISKVEEKTNA
jgi:DNA repair exonuclease SbcCD ATPase subunit